MVAAASRRPPLFLPAEEPAPAAVTRTLPVSPRRMHSTLPGYAQLKAELPPALAEQLDLWIDRYLAQRGQGWLLSPADFLHWLFRHPELPDTQRGTVAHLLALELIQQERQVRRDQLERFYRWNRASRRRLRRGELTLADRVVANPLVVRLGWQEASGQQGVQTAQEVQWLFFPAETRLVALRPKPGVLELLAPLARSGAQGISLGQWLEELSAPQAARLLRLLPELFQLGLAALAP